MMSLELLLTIVGVTAVFTALFGVLIYRFYRHVEPGRALVVMGTREGVRVSFTGATVLPVVHRAEAIDLTLKSFAIDRSGADGLMCRDGVRADVRVRFYVAVSPLQQDISKVAQAIGCARAGDPKTLEELFMARFSEALRRVLQGFEFADVVARRQEFKDQLVEVIGEELGGFRLEEVALERLDMTAASELDPRNIRDAEGLRKVRRVTSELNRQAEALEQQLEEIGAGADTGVHEEITALEQRIATLQGEISRYAFGKPLV